MARIFGKNPDEVLAMADKVTSDVLARAKKKNTVASEPP